MRWFTENPWPLMILCGIGAAVLVFLWSWQKRAAHLLSALGLVLLALVIFIAERQILTDAERVERNVYGLTRSFRLKDKPTTLDYFSPQADDLKKIIEWAWDYVEVRDDMRISDMSVTMPDQNTAVSQFRANATVSV